MSRLVCIALCLVLVVDLACGHGKLFVGLAAYGGHGNRDVTGSCCDGEEAQSDGACRDPCDLVFQLSAFGLDGQNVTNKRFSGLPMSQLDLDLVEFPLPRMTTDTINPALFSFKKWQNNITILIQVFDVDEQDGTTGLQLVDEFTHTLTMDGPSDMYDCVHMNSSKRNSTNLQLAVRYTCDPTYAGADCSTDCLMTSQPHLCPARQRKALPTAHARTQASNFFGNPLARCPVPVVLPTPHTPTTETSQSSGSEVTSQSPPTPVSGSTISATTTDAPGNESERKNMSLTLSTPDSTTVDLNPTVTVHTPVSRVFTTEFPNTVNLQPSTGAVAIGQTTYSPAATTVGTDTQTPGGRTDGVLPPQSSLPATPALSASTDSADTANPTTAERPEPTATTGINPTARTDGTDPTVQTTRSTGGVDATAQPTQGGSLNPTATMPATTVPTASASPGIANPTVLIDTAGASVDPSIKPSRTFGATTRVVDFATPSVNPSHVTPTADLPTAASSATVVTPTPGHRTESSDSHTQGPTSQPSHTHQVTASEVPDPSTTTPHGERTSQPTAATSRPDGTPVTPVNRPVTTQGGSVTPDGSPATPTGRPATPTGRPATPTGRPVSPEGSPATPSGTETTPIFPQATTPIPLDYTPSSMLPLTADEPEDPMKYWAVIVGSVLGGLALVGLVGYVIYRSRQKALIKHQEIYTVTPQMVSSIEDNGTSGRSDVPMTTALL